MNKVTTLQDIPELLLDDTLLKETPKMKTPGTRGPAKKTLIALDKMVQFIWDYQQKNGGDTPKLTTIAQNAGVTNPSSATIFMNRLIDDGRVNKISSMPFRVTLTDHPANRRAIESFKRLRAAKETFEAQERDRIRARQTEEAAITQLEQDKQALFTAADTQLMEKPATVPTMEQPYGKTEQEPVARTTDPHAAVARFLAARQETTLANKDLKRVMPQLVKVADTRDLMVELIERGDVVSKR
jgi:Mn-dependent DtxR family transcriptional regulator